MNGSDDNSSNCVMSRPNGRAPHRNAAKTFLLTLKRLIKEENVDDDSALERNDEDDSSRNTKNKKKKSPSKKTKGVKRKRNATSIDRAEKNSSNTEQPIRSDARDVSQAQTSDTAIPTDKNIEESHACSGSTLCLTSCEDGGAGYSGGKRKRQSSRRVQDKRCSRPKLKVTQQQKPATDLETAEQGAGSQGGPEQVTGIQVQDSAWGTVCEVRKSGINQILWPLVPRFLDYDSDTEIVEDHRIYTCSLCKTRFQTLDNLNKHKPCKRSIACKFCDKRFRCAYELKRHQTNTRDCGKRASQKTDQSNLCPNCGKSFSSAGSLNVHRQTHKEYKPHQCSHCGKSFSQLGNMKSHVRVVHEKVKSFLCPQCGKAYSQQSGLDYHLRTHLEEKLQQDYRELMTTAEGPVPPNATDLENSNEKIFFCPICQQSYPKVFLWLRHLKGHLDKDSGLPDAHRDNLQLFVRKHYDFFTIKTYSCADCQQVFFLKQDLTDHVEKHHMAAKSYKCEFCNREFKAKRTLRVHVQHHTKKYRLTCEKCGEGFALKNSLTYHMHKVHKVALPEQYQCKACTEVFRNRAMLETHKRAAHNAKKKFECEVCLKTFATKYAQQVHTRTHTNEKPYPCTLCPRSFADQSNLIHHGAKVHPAAPKASFYRRKGWTTEKMDQVAAGTVLSIDSSQLETMHELSSLKVEDLPAPTPEDKAGEDAIKNIDLAESLPLTDSQFFTKLVDTADSVKPQQDRQLNAADTDREVTGSSADASILSSENVCFEFDQENQLSPPTSIQILQTNESLALTDVPLATPPLPKDPVDASPPLSRDPAEISPILDIMELGAPLAPSEPHINTTSIGQEICIHVSHKESSVEPMIHQRTLSAVPTPAAEPYANEMGTSQVALNLGAPAQPKLIVCSETSSARSPEPAAVVDPAALSGIHTSFSDSLLAPAPPGSEGPDCTGHMTTVNSDTITSLEMPSSEIGSWQSMLETVQQVVRMDDHEGANVIQLVVKDSEDENSTYIVYYG